jgi:ribosomal protein S7
MGRKSESIKKIEISQIEKLIDEVLKDCASGDNESVNTIVSTTLKILEKRVKEAVNGKED